MKRSETEGGELSSLSMRIIGACAPIVLSNFGNPWDRLKNGGHDMDVPCLESLQPSWARGSACIVRAVDVRPKTRAIPARWDTRRPYAFTGRGWQPFQ